MGVKSFGAGCFDSGRKLGAETRYSVLHRVAEKDFVYPKLMAWEGAFGVVPAQFDGWLVSPEFCVFRPDENQVDIRYLGYLFQRPQTWETIAGSSIGTNLRRRRLYPEDFLAKMIELPEPSEQRRVTAMLDRITRMVDRVSHKMTMNGSPSPTAVLPAVVDAVFGRFSINSRPLADIAETVTDVVRPGNDPSPAEAFIGLQHIERHTGRQLGMLDVGAEAGPKARFAPGDVLYPRLRPYLNKVWCADRHGLCSTDQYVLRPFDSRLSRILAFALRGRSCLNQAIDLTSRLQHPRIRRLDLLSIKLPNVSPSNYERTLQALERVSTRVTAIGDLRRAAMARAEALRESVLNQAFAGEL